VLVSSIKGKIRCGNYHPLRRIVLMGVIGYPRYQSRSQFLEGCMAVPLPRELIGPIAGFVPRGFCLLWSGMNGA
jgi:hypothetical protein